MKKHKRPMPKEKIIPIWVIVLIFLALSLIYFYPVIGPNRMIYGSDQLISGYMFKNFAAQYMRQHNSLPQWNPYIFSGLPYIDAFHGDALYYTTLLRYFLPVHQVMAWVFIIQVFLAGLGMFLLLKSLRINQCGALIIGIAYMFTGSLISTTYAGHDGKAIVASFLPWIFLFLNKGLDTKKILYFLLGGLVIGASLLSPHVQMTYYLLMAIFFYLCYRLYFIYREDGGIKLTAKLFGYFWLMVAAGFLISAIQFLPAYFYLPYSPRAGMGRGYGFATSWSMPPLELFDLLTPHFSGILDNYWGTNYFKQHTEYLGIFPLILSVIALAYCWKDRRVKFFTGLGIFGVLMALGGNTPLYRIPYHIVPLLKNFRAPSLIFYLVSFSVCVLAGFGINSLLELKKDQVKRLIMGLGITVGVIGLLAIIASSARTDIVAGLRSYLRPRLISAYGPNLTQQKLNNLYSNYQNFQSGIWIAFSLILINGGLIIAIARRRLKLPIGMIFISGLLIFDLWSVDKKFLKMVEHPDQFYAPDEVVRFLQKDRSLYRVFPFQFAGMDLYRHDNYLMLYNIQSVGGYHGNQLGRYQEFIGAENTIMFQNPQNLYNRRFLDLLNVKYIVTTRLPGDLSGYKKEIREVLEAMKSWLNQFELSFQGQRCVIYRNESALPRALLVPTYEVIKEDEKILQRLKEVEFDPRRLVILEEYPGVELKSDTHNIGECGIISYDPNRIVVEANCLSPGFLILSENHYPAWQAYVDGEQSKIYQGDYLLRAVFLDQGHHIIEFRYNSPFYRWGLVITLFSLLGIVASIIILRYRPK
jgi:hypothetical protein